MRNYVIERRQESGDGFGDWAVVQISYQAEVTLTNQPVGIHLEYHVKAVNGAGTGLASNTVSVIL